jgi:hypothetical protein
MDNSGIPIDQLGIPVDQVDVPAVEVASAELPVATELTAEQVEALESIGAKGEENELKVWQRFSCFGDKEKGYTAEVMAIGSGLRVSGMPDFVIPEKWYQHPYGTKFNYSPEEKAALMVLFKQAIAEANLFAIKATEKAKSHGYTLDEPQLANPTWSVDFVLQRWPAE